MKVSVFFLSSLPRLRLGEKGKITHILNDMAVIADEENRPTVRQVDLHAHQPVRVPGQVVQGDALAEIEGALVEGLPVPALDFTHLVSRIRLQQP